MSLAVTPVSGCDYIDRQQRLTDVATSAPLKDYEQGVLRITFARQSGKGITSRCSHLPDSLIRRGELYNVQNC